MIKFRAIFTCTLFVAVGFGLLQQSSRIEFGYKKYLGFSLMPGANSTAVTFHIITKWEDPIKPIEAVNISEREFVSIASGLMKSEANPKMENLFANAGMENCGWFNDTIINMRFYESGTRCNTVNDIWRLRYREWPYYIRAPRGNANTLIPAGPGPGWARDTLRPSDGQLLFLQAYGADDPMVNAFWGAQAFRLLKDMQDPAWVSTYRGL